MEQLIVLILFVLALTYLIYRCGTGRQAMPEGGIQVNEEPAMEVTQEPIQFPKIYIHAAARSSRRRAYGAGCAGTGAALQGSWHSDLNSSLFRGGDIEMEDTPFPESDFTDCSISTGGFIDMIHGGIDPTGQGGMAGDFNPDHHFEDSFSHSDPFDSGFGTTDFGGIDNSIGCDTSIGCGIGFE